MGQYNDSIFGLYGPGNGGNWKFAYDLKNTRMGIGSTSAQYPLVFSDAIGDKISFYGGSNTPSSDHYGMGIQGSLQMCTPVPSTDIAFGVGRSDALTENVRFTGSGRVGIGTNTPSATLHVVRGTTGNGTAEFDGTVNSSHFNYSANEDTYIRGGLANSKVIINDVSSGNIGLFTSTPNYPLTLLSQTGNGFVHTDGTTEIGTYVGSGVGYLQTYTNHPLAFATNNGAAQMTLIPAGFLGIGTSTPGQKLDVFKGRIRFTGAVSVGNPSGIEFTNTTGTTLKGFIGQRDDTNLGIYGFAGSGWSFNHNVATG